MLDLPLLFDVSCYHDWWIPSIILMPLAIVGCQDFWIILSVFSDQQSTFFGFYWEQYCKLFLHHNWDLLGFLFHYFLLLTCWVVERFKEAEEDNLFRKVKCFVEEEEGEEIVCLCSQMFFRRRQTFGNLLLLLFQICILSSSPVLWMHLMYYFGLPIQPL